MKILAINPGSTSTKWAVFEDEKELASANTSHDADALGLYKTISDQMPYRRDILLGQLEASGIALEDIDVFVGRGGGLISLEGGVYLISELLLTHAVEGANGVQHPAQLGPQLAYELASHYGKPSFVVNPPDVDEIQDEARLTGIKGIYRNVHLHALNLKEMAIRHAVSSGTVYEDANYIACHIGGGISVSAHRKGKMIDGFDIVGGEGPMAPTRCGSIPVLELVSCLEKTDVKKVRNLCTKEGGFANLLGTSDAREVSRRAADGDEKARLIWSSMIYQICKCIGSMAAVLHGKVDGILLGGGMVFNEELVEKIEETCGFIAPVFAYPGEFEMEAMASGALRVMTGQEKPKTYTGIPVWQEFKNKMEA